MNKKTTGLLVLFSLVFLVSNAQSELDSLSVIELNEILIQSSTQKDYLPDVYGTQIFAGKKTDLITLSGAEANLAKNVGRMAFAKIPGVNNWDMDGAGTQLNVGTRGTDAHRCIEMNMRQNGYNTNSDMFGYPENHYTVPLQGVKQVQLVRGSAALQFGSQFGGMMNYVMKEGDPNKPISIESEQTYGSYNFFNSFNAVGGTKGKISYYAYYDDRHGDGWRSNSAFQYKAYYAHLKYSFSKKGSLSFQFSRMNYRQQTAGGLTDAQFEDDNRQSDRTRNYFRPMMNIPAMILNYSLSENTKLEVSVNGIWGERSSVQFINPPTVSDTFNTDINSYNPRQVDRDFYAGITTEARLLHHYQLGTIRSTLTGGVRYFNQTTKRRQKGVGTTGSDFDMSLIGDYGIDLKFHTTNYAVFAENLFQLTDKFSVTPGFRMEVIQSDLTGLIDNASFPVSYQGDRKFPLFGLGLQHQLSTNSQLYGNISQAYRPYLYANVTPADQIGIVDPNIKDSKGYDVDLGYRGKIKDFLTLDVNAFYLFYGDKIGKLSVDDGNGSTYLFTTNVGNSVAKGVEAYISVSLPKLFGVKKGLADVRIFNSIAYTHVRYVSGEISVGGENLSLAGHRVENVPDWINRTGLELEYKGFSSTFQSSYVSLQYNDANNTEFTATASAGKIPSYFLLDWSAKWKINQFFYLSGGVNNLGNTKYFSRRINTYPGPGILPGDGRTFYISAGIKI